VGIYHRPLPKWYGSDVKLLLNMLKPEGVENTLTLAFPWNTCGEGLITFFPAKNP